jgi:hypothetical protein
MLEEAIRAADALGAAFHARDAGAKPYHQVRLIFGRPQAAARLMAASASGDAPARK